VTDGVTDIVGDGVNVGENVTCGVGEIEDVIDGVTVGVNVGE
jgi:hypothetical protein